MKKRYLILAGLLVMTVAAAGCGKKKTTETAPVEVTATPTPEVTKAVDMVDDGHEHDRQRDGDPRQPLRHAGAVVGLAHEHEVGHGRHGKHDDRDQLLRDPGGQMPEPVEDALPVLQVEEHRDPAGRQQHGRADPSRHLRLLPHPEHGHQRLRPEQPRAPRHQRGEQNQRPLEFHYSSPFQSRLRRMNAKFGSLPTFGR